MKRLASAAAAVALVATGAVAATATPAFAATFCVYKTTVANVPVYATAFSTTKVHTIANKGTSLSAYIDTTNGRRKLLTLFPGDWVPASDLSGTGVCGG